MTPESLRQLVADKCDPERYRRFLELFNRKARRRGRLAYWQQNIIDDLAADYPELAEIAVDDMVPAFRLCHVHLEPLVDCRVCAYRADEYDSYLAPEFEAAQREHFPYTPTFAMVGPDHNDSHVTLDQCAECVSAMNQYNTTKFGN